MANVTVKLLNTSNQVIASTTTDADGNYLFSDLSVGSYAVQFASPAGYVFTTKNAGTDGEVDSDADASGRTAFTALTAGENDLSWDAGLAHEKICLTYDFSGNSSSSGTA